MKKFLLLIFLLAISCSSKSFNNNNNNNISFSDIMTFEEFKNRLIKYDKMNSYPNIDN